ncbi:hypothetical protein, partial [Enterobacter cloacae complex sp. 2DZ2F20B]|uniref:hypothetical protein n=1 Tax=Enterobacter cloacae complex sp. 2DZ2F20B TaxID=2511993 RepID=UPI001CA486D6
ATDNKVFRIITNETMTEDDTYVIKGPPPLKEIPSSSLGKIIYEKLSTEFENEAAFVSNLIK